MIRYTTARVRTRVEKREQVVDEPLLHEEVSAERVAVDQEIRGKVPTVRGEKRGVLVIPVIEEVLVVTKQLRLKEELRVTRRSIQIRKPQKLELRREVIEVERIVNGKAQAMAVKGAEPVAPAPAPAGKPTKAVEPPSKRAATRPAARPSAGKPRKKGHK